MLFCEIAGLSPFYPPSLCFQTWPKRFVNKIKNPYSVSFINDTSILFKRRQNQKQKEGEKRWKPVVIGSRVCMRLKLVGWRMLEEKRWERIIKYVLRNQLFVVSFFHKLLLFLYHGESLHLLHFASTSQGIVFIIDNFS